MNSHDATYHKILQDVLANGVESEDRTGTGTISTFGGEYTFDLKAGFPLITTKKVHWKSVVGELLWFLSGSTNNNDLINNYGVTIWNEWADVNGNLGPVYGKSWRNFGAKPSKIPQPIPNMNINIKRTYLGVANGAGKEGHLLKKTWEGMIDRCYNVNNIMYKNYGEKGVHVCNEWLNFKDFEKDAKNLEGWENKKNNPKKYNLDKDSIGDGFLYSPKTCKWVTTKENQNLKNNKIYTVKKDETLYTFTSPTDFCKEHKISDKNFSDLWTSKAKKRYGFELVSIQEKNDGIDQIANVIEQIKTNPNSRRLIVSAWDSYWIKYAKLPPCHAFFQFYVRNGELSCKLTQRSADAFLGVPFNIASYALLTHMIAQVCGLGVDKLIMSFGDLHIYKNHLDQVKEQLSRDSFYAPSLNLNQDIKDIDHFKVSDIVLENYTSHPAIKAPVAV